MLTHPPRPCRRPLIHHDSKAGPGMLPPPPTDDDLLREMAWTSWARSCRNPAITPDNSLRQCRRPTGHDGDCASGFGRNLRRWQA